MTEPPRAGPRPHPQVVARGHGGSLIVPDAGPLITFGQADLLDLLLAPGLPVWLVDQVVHEVTRDVSRPDARAVARFVAEHPLLVRVFPTQVGTFAAHQREDGFTGRQRGLG